MCPSTQTCSTSGSIPHQLDELINELCDYHHSMYLQSIKQSVNHMIADLETRPAVSSRASYTLLEKAPASESKAAAANNSYPSRLHASPISIQWSECYFLPRCCADERVMAMGDNITLNPSGCSSRWSRNDSRHCKPTIHRLQIEV